MFILVLSSALLIVVGCGGISTVQQKSIKNDYEKWWRSSSEDWDDFGRATTDEWDNWDNWWGTTADEWDDYWEDRDDWRKTTTDKTDDYWDDRDDWWKTTTDEWDDYWDDRDNWRTTPDEWDDRDNWRSTTTDEWDDRDNWPTTTTDEWDDRDNWRTTTTDEWDRYVAIKSSDFALILAIVVPILFLISVVIACFLCQCFSCKNSNSSSSSRRTLHPPPTASVQLSPIHNAELPSAAAFVNYGAEVRDASNTIGANDMPPMYADVVLGDFHSDAIKYYEVKVTVPETPPPQYQPSSTLKY